MPRKAYILTFDKGFVDSFNYQIFHDQLISANGISNWWHYLETTYILIVDSNVKAKNMGDFITSLMPNKKFFVCELKLSNSNGWLPVEGWDWIKSQLPSVVN